MEMDTSRRPDPAANRTTGSFGRVEDQLDRLRTLERKHILAAAKVPGFYDRQPVV